MLIDTTFFSEHAGRRNPNKFNYRGILYPDMKGFWTWYFTLCPFRDNKTASSAIILLNITLKETVICL